MKPIKLVISSMVVGLLFAGCASYSQPTPKHHEASSVKPAAPAPTASPVIMTGAACTKCVCGHFEPQSDNAAVCRMCGHALADHTRR